MLVTRIKINLKKFFRNKLNYIIIMLLGICLSFSVIINSLSYSGRKYFEDNILNWVDYRNFILLPIENQEKRDKVINTLNSMPEVIAVHDRYSYLKAFNILEFKDYYDGEEYVWVQGIGSPIKALKGQDLTTSDELEMICPVSYYPFDDINGLNGKDTTRGIDLTPYIGKKLTLQYIDNKYPKTYKIKLVGLYDNDKLQRNYETCYMNYKALETIGKQLEPQKNQYNNIIYEIGNIIDEQKVSNTLKDMGYWPDSIIFGERTIALASMNALKYISYGMIALSTFIIILITIYNISKNKSNLMLNKTLGYKNKNLILNYLVDIICLFITSVFVSLIMIFILLNIFRKLIPKFYLTYKNIPIIISLNYLIKAIIILLGICILIGIINFIFNLKTNLYKMIVEEKD